MFSILLAITPVVESQNALTSLLMYHVFVEAVEVLAAETADTVANTTNSQGTAASTTRVLGVLEY